MGRKSQMPERNLAVIEGFVSRLEVLDYDSVLLRRIIGNQGRALPGREGLLDL